MSLRKLAITGALVALVAGCATPTVYGPAELGNGFGYRDLQLEQNRYRVSFSGNSLTDLRTVETFLLYRASELTLERGYDWFETVDRGVDEDRRYRGTSYDNFSTFRGCHPFYGCRSFFGGGFNSIDLREITEYEATMEIRLGQGDKPVDNLRVYDAREVQRNLSTQLAAVAPQ